MAVAVIDIWMTGMSGLEVQTKLQVVSPKTRVIINTANDHDSVRNAAIEAGADAYFVKPFDRRLPCHRAPGSGSGQMKGMWASLGPIGHYYYTLV
jgi:DNA-binding NarL/FixJ family response regulator